MTSHPDHYSVQLMQYRSEASLVDKLLIYAHVQHCSLRALHAPAEKLYISNTCVEYQCIVPLRPLEELPMFWPVQCRQPHLLVSMLAT